MLATPEVCVLSQEEVGVTSQARRPFRVRPHPIAVTKSDFVIAQSPIQIPICLNLNGFVHRPKFTKLGNLDFGETHEAVGR